MYEAFYGLQRQPFTNIPDPDCLYLSGHHRQALSVLRYALSTRAGFCVVTGNVGAGKTTLVRSLLKDMGGDLEVGLVSNTQCESFEELMRWILLAFDLDYHGKDKIEMYEELVNFMIESFNQGRPVTLIIDEAQHLGASNLEQLRMLSNVNTERGLILQTILVGQPELWDLLRRPELQQFTQRISYDYYLAPLPDVESVRAYIEHRLTYAGAERQIFDEETYKEVFTSTGGVPRLINLICDTALVYGFAEEQEIIGLDIVRKVVADKANSVAPMLQEGVVGAVGSSRTGKRRTSTIERAVIQRKSKSS